MGSPSAMGGCRQCKRREILNGVRYMLRTGCAWRLLPHDFPNWNAVYHYFSTWKARWHLERIRDQLHGDLQQSAGRTREPSTAIIDSQSVKTTESGSQRLRRGQDNQREKAASPCRYARLTHRRRPSSRRRSRSRRGKATPRSVGPDVEAATAPLEPTVVTPAQLVAWSARSADGTEFA